MAAKKNRDYRSFVAEVEKLVVSKQILLEEQLEDDLASNLGKLRRFGYDLELISRQVTCTGGGGRIDLLCRDRSKRRYVVVELKNVRAGRNTFGQLHSYIGWVQANVAGRQLVDGLIISRGYHTQLEFALKTSNKVKQIDLQDLGFE